MITTFLIEHFSYWILFIWSILEGEIGLALAGFLSQEGSFSFVNVVLIAISGAFIGDVSLFLIGRFFDKRVQKYLIRYDDRLKRIKKWFKNNVVWLILFERFVYGTHIPSLLFIGMSGYSLGRFLFLDIIGITLWALVFTSLGCFFGQSVVNVLMIAQQHLSLLLLMVVAVGVIVMQTKRGAP